MGQSSLLREYKLATSTIGVDCPEDRVGGAGELREVKRQTEIGDRSPVMEKWSGGMSQPGKQDLRGRRGQDCCVCWFLSPSQASYPGGMLDQSSG